MSAYAREIGVTLGYLCDVMRERRDPGPKILLRFGLRAVRTTTILYEEVA